MKKALNQWCFKENTEIEKLLLMSKTCGFDGLEFNLYESGNERITLDSSESFIRSVKRSADAFEIELKSLATGLYWDSSLTHNDESVRQHARNLLRRQLEIAHLLEVDTVLVVPGLVDEQTPYDKVYQRSIDAIQSLVSTAESYGVRIGIENVWNQFLLSPLEMCQFIDTFDSRFVGVYFDVGNVLQFGTPEDWIRTLGRRILKVHVKDFLKSVGNLSGFVPLLAGDVHWGFVRQALDDVAYDDYVTAELTPYRFFDDLLPEHTASALNRIFSIGGEAQ